MGTTISTALNNRMCIEGSNVGGTGIPLNIFPTGWQVPPNIDIHEAVRIAFSQFWSDELVRNLKEYVICHVQNNELLKQTVQSHGLTDDEAAAIVYYTADITRYVKDREHNLYKLLNTHLYKRKLPESLLPYVNYLFCGLHKLPNFQGTVYRGLDVSLVKLSSQYKPNNMVVWVAFTSTTKDLNIMKEFTTQNDKGTWMSLEVSEGKEITCFSIYPNESEILFLPNTRFCVVDVLSENMKLLIGIQPTFDCLTMKQQPMLQLDHLVLPEPEQPKSEKPMWFLVINKLATLPHEVMFKSTDFNEILLTYKSQPLNYTCALIYIEGKSFPKIKKFYGNPLFRDGMLKLAQKTQNL